MGKQNKELENFLTTISKTDDGNKLMQVAEIMKSLFDIGIDANSLCKIKDELQPFYKDKTASISTNEFIKVFRKYTDCESQEIETKLISFLQEEENSINISKLNNFIEFYSYIPMSVKKEK